MTWPLRGSALLCPILAVAAYAASAGGAAPSAAAVQPTTMTAHHAESKIVQLFDAKGAVIGAERHVLLTGAVVLSATNMRVSCERLFIVLDVQEAPSTGSGQAVPTITLGGTNIGGSARLRSQFKTLLATGSVRILQGNREAVAGRAEIFPRDERIILTERPVLTERTPGEPDQVLTGDRISWQKNGVIEGDNVRYVGPEIEDLSPKSMKDAPPGTAAPK